jgi:TonB-dependent receptor
MATATAGRRYWSNRIGVLVSGAYQNVFRGTESELFTVSVDPRTRNTLYTGIQTRNYFSQLQRSGLNAVLDYRIHANHKLTLTNIYKDLREFQTRTIVDTSFVSNRSTPGTGRIDLFERSRLQVQSIRSHNLQGEHRIGRTLLVDWSAVYADARQRVPDLTEYNRSYVITEAPGSPDSARFDNIVKEWQSNNDEDYAAYLNVTYKSTFLGTRMEWKAGGLYRDKIRNNKFNNYKLLFNGISPYSSSIQDVDIAQLQVVYNPDNAFFNNENFRATENVTAYYIQTRFLIGDLQVLTGFRTELTTQRFVTNARRTFNTPSEASVSYTDFLPSIHFKYMLNDYTNLRFSAFKSISRPSYFELVPYRIVGENFIEQGNFQLKRTEADNFDVKYEWFPGRNRHFSGGLFYKSIRNPVEYGFTDASGSTVSPQNFGTATNYGLELVGMQFWGSWGVSANYTYTSSSLTMRKIRNEDTLTFEVNETRPLQGQSTHIANASLLYKNERAGLNIQLAYVLTGRRIVQISPLEGKDFIQQDLHLLDLSVEKTIHRYLMVFGKFTNLLNTPYRESVADGTLVRTDFYAQNYLFGIRYKL